MRSPSTFLDDIAQMNADTEHSMLAIGPARPALRSIIAFWSLDRASHGVDDAAELNEGAVAGALDDAPVVDGDGRINQIAAQGSEAR